MTCLIEVVKWTARQRPEHEIIPKPIQAAPGRNPTAYGINRDFVGRNDKWPPSDKQYDGSRRHR